MIQKNLFTKPKQIHRLKRRNSWLWGAGRGIVREFGIYTYTLLFLEWIINKDLLYSTGNSAKYYVTT